MDLSTILGDTLTTQIHPWPQSSHLCLVLSHSTCSHEPVVCDLLSQLLKSGPKVTQPNADPVSPKPLVLLVALHKSSQFYHRLLGQTLVPTDLKRGLKIVDLTTFDNVAHNFSGDAQLGETFLDRIQVEVDAILTQSDQGQPSSVHIFIDNLTCLIDLGGRLRRLDNLLNQWLTHPHCSCHVTLGCHVGLDFKDELASEMEPSLVYAIQLWKARATVVLEMQPLATGYTASVDGQISIYKRPKSRQPTGHEASHLFHYKYEGKRVICYAPGTSKLLT